MSNVKLYEVEVDGIKEKARECTTCKHVKTFSEFQKNKNNKLGISSKCKACVREYSRIHYQQNKEHHADRVKKYRNANPDKVEAWSKNEARREKSRKHYAENRDRYREYSKQYHRENKELIAEKDRKRRLMNLDKIKESKRRYYLENKEEIIRKNSEYVKENKDVILAIRLRRMARKKFLVNVITSDKTQEILANFDGKCALTGEGDIQVDHFIALATGHGGTYEANLIPLSQSLNASKKDRNPFEWVKGLKAEDKKAFYKTVEYLADLNKLSAGEYERFVTWCYDNPRGIDEIKDDGRPSIKIWKETNEAPRETGVFFMSENTEAI